MAKPVLVDPLTMRPTPESRIERAKVRIRSLGYWQKEILNELEKVNKMIEEQKEIIKKNGGQVD